MKNILIHGLGQNSQSWDKTAIYLKKNGIDTICPDLFKITDNTFADYKKMYEAFSDFCNNQDGKVNLCGLL